MTNQFLLPGFDPEPAATDRIFFAAIPDAGAIARIIQLTGDLKARHLLRGKAIDQLRLHVTLCNLGDFAGMPNSLLAHAASAAAATAAALACFSISLDMALTFATRSRHRPFVLCGGDGVIGLNTLYQNLSQALVRAGLPGSPLSYTPHLTLLYDDLTIAEQAIAPVEWTVRELVLLHSRIGQNLPYTILGRWPLQTVPS